MNHSAHAYIQHPVIGADAHFNKALPLNSQSLLLDSLIPGFSLFSTALYSYTRIDLSVYIPAILCLGLLALSWSYVSNWLWGFLHQYLMCTADIRIDDEIYNMLMSWVANQQFSTSSRHFVANTNLNSRRLWWLFDDEEEEEEEDDENKESRGYSFGVKSKKDKKVLCTPSFGSHWFWYRGQPLIFCRHENQQQMSWGAASERESISLSSFGRNPRVLKELLDECRQAFSKKDQNQTIIYRGGLKAGSSEPAWTRCGSRASRPFSTVVLDEKVKQELLDDMTDYLKPELKRWYANRGIPYRRGYLLWGPCGCGKSSLSFAIAGYFNLKIYIVSLNSPAMNEENLSRLFSELPKKCVVLLEDIDTAGLTHSRDAAAAVPAVPEAADPVSPNPGTVAPTNNARLSLSALLNIIDGVAATEGRILIMTTNHLDKLDDALIRPGRVDVTVKFDLANTQMVRDIFQGIFTRLEGDETRSKSAVTSSTQLLGGASDSKEEILKRMALEKEILAAEQRRRAEEEKVARLSKEFAASVPAMQFSPAEIQGYLLKHKRDPERAVRGAADWVRLQEEERRKKKEREEAERLKMSGKKSEDKVVVGGKDGKKDQSGI